MNLQNMAPNAKRSLLLTLVFGAVAAGLYFAGIEPTEARLARLTKTREELASKHHLMKQNLAQADATKARLEKLEADMSAYRAASLVPLLESYAMRAKALVDPLALEAGLFETEYESLPAIALPVPKRLPAQLYARCPVRITARGSYQAAVSFLLRLEREMPLVALESLAVTAQGEPDVQQIQMILEWPVKGAVTRK